DRRAVADRVRAEGFVERVERDRLRRRARTTVRQRLDEDEGAEGRHRDREQRERGDRSKAWQGVVPETPPGVRAVDPGGFVDVARDGLERAEEDEHGEGRPSP